MIKQLVYAGILGLGVAFVIISFLTNEPLWILPGFAAIFYGGINSIIEAG